MTDELKRLPSPGELDALLRRYFIGPIPGGAAGALITEVAKLLADESRRRGEVRLFAPENQVSWGEAWREEYATRSVPTPLDHALMLAAKTRGFPPPRPYCPPAMVATWEQVAGEDGAPRWQLAADGAFRATGRMQRASRWCVHRGGTGLDRLWLVEESGARTSIVIAEVRADAMRLMSPWEIGSELVFHRL